MREPQLKVKYSVPVLCLPLFAVLLACSSGNDYLNSSRLKGEALGLAQAWLAHAPTSNGFQTTGLDGNWRPTQASRTVTLTSQARLIYIYAAAFELSGDEKYLKALRNAADFMLLYMRTDDSNGWFKTVDSSGNAVDKRIHSYGYSFVIFAMSHAYRVSQDPRYLEQAISTWQSSVWPGLSAARHWQVNGTTPANTDPQKIWSQNPYMHLFEALLSLHQVTQSPEVWNDIEAMASFMREKLLQPCGCLPETFRGEGFIPANDQNTHLYLGHQLEWAFLLSQAMQQGLDKRYLSTANRLLQFSLRNGVNENTGGLHATTNSRGELQDENYWWWAQAELMRASVHFAREHDKHELWSIYEKSHLFARMHFIDLYRGNWTSESQVFTKASSEELRQVIGYHWMAFYVESLRLNRLN